MSADPFKIYGDTLISFSGGRTSAYMLRRILDAHDGELPHNKRVVFANTGKERAETLRFVHQVGAHWDVPVTWVEYRDNEAGFEIVNYATASRNGEPFAALIAKRGYVPNSQMRFCTSVLKVRTMRKFMVALGLKHYTNAVGLRADEQWRVAKGMSRNAEGRDPWTTVWPLATAGVTKRDVMAFWAEQPFDLELRDYEGNCDLCFLKRRARLERLIRDGVDPTWWIEQERACSATAATASRFNPARSYDDLRHAVEQQPLLIDDDDVSDDHDAECGLLCEPTP